MRSAGKRKGRNNDGTIYPPSGQTGRDRGTRRETQPEAGLSQWRTGLSLRYAAYPTDKGHGGTTPPTSGME